MVYSGNWSELFEFLTPNPSSAPSSHPFLFGCSVFNTNVIPFTHSTCSLGWVITVEKRLLNASVSQETCNTGCVWVFLGGLAKRFRGKCTLSFACISANQYRARLGRAGSNSCIMTCSNERENSPTGCIYHTSATTNCLLFHPFSSIPFLLASIWKPPLSHLVAIPSLDWQVSSNQCGDVEAVGFRLLPMWSDVYIVFLATFRPSQTVPPGNWWLEV